MCSTSLIPCTAMDDHLLGPGVISTGLFHGSSTERRSVDSFGSRWHVQACLGQRQVLSASASRAARRREASSRGRESVRTRSTVSSSRSRVSLDRVPTRAGQIADHSARNRQSALQGNLHSVQELSVPQLSNSHSPGDSTARFSHSLHGGARTPRL